MNGSELIVFIAYSEMLNYSGVVSVSFFAGQNICKNHFLFLPVFLVSGYLHLEHCS